jgi:hypothetical protein
MSMPAPRTYLHGLGSLSALAAEGCAAWALLAGHPLSALLLHVSAAGMLACAACVVARPDGQARRAAGVASLLIALSLPLVGPLGMCSVVLPGWRAQRKCGPEPVLELDMPDFDAEAASDAASARPVPVEAVLLSQSSVRQRVEAVMALRRMDVQRAVPLLRVALADSCEDVRLLAYAILERRDKVLRSRISAGIAQLPAADTGLAGADPSPPHVLRDLAHAHWELVRGEFVQGQTAQRTLQQALHYAAAAFHAQPDGSLALMLARIQLRIGNAEAAVGYLASARAAGVAEAVCLPLLAEAAFTLRRFEAIPALWARVDEAQLQRPGLAAVVDFWTGSAAE